MYVIKASPEMKELASQVPIFIEDLRPVVEQPYVWAVSMSSGPEERALLDYFEINVFPEISQQAERDGLLKLERDSPSRTICLEKRGMIWPPQNKVAALIVLDSKKLVLRHGGPIERLLSQIDAAAASAAAADAGGSEPSEIHDRPPKVVNTLIPTVPPAVRDKVYSLIQNFKLPRIVEIGVRLQSSSQFPYPKEKVVLEIGDTLVLNGSEIMGLAAGGLPLVSTRCKGERKEVQPTAGVSISANGRST